MGREAERGVTDDHQVASFGNGMGRMCHLPRWEDEKMGRFSGWRWRWGGIDKLDIFPVTESSAYLPVSASLTSLCHLPSQPTPTPHLTPSVPHLQ